MALSSKFYVHENFFETQQPKCLYSSGYYCSSSSIYQSNIKWNKDQSEVYFLHVESILSARRKYTSYMQIEYITNITIGWTSWLALSTDPWDWGCLGLPLTRTHSGHKFFNFFITLLTNSLPLSDWRIKGHPWVVKIWYNSQATAVAAKEKTTTNYLLIY